MGAVSKTPSPLAKQAYKRGLALFGKDRLEEAAAAYDEALAQAPDWADPLQAKGMALLRAGKLEQALEIMKRVCELTPSDPLAFTSLSMAYVRLERIEEAESAQATARMLTWQEEVRANPAAQKPDPGPPPGAKPAGR